MIIRAGRAVRAALRAVASVLAECNEAALVVAARRTAPDRYAPDPYRAPDTYAEFLFRTSGMLVHEPRCGRRRTRQH
jgi:hypothetical protein